MAETPPHCSRNARPRYTSSPCSPTPSSSPSHPLYACDGLQLPVYTPSRFPQAEDSDSDLTQTQASVENLQCDGCPSLADVQADESLPYEDFSFTLRTPGTPEPAVGATSLKLQDDVVKSGFLGKQHWNCRSYFVLRRASRTGPSRLEWQDTEMEKPGGNSEQFGPDRQRVIYLKDCLDVHKLASSMDDLMVVLYTKDCCLNLVAEDPVEQDDWHTAIAEMIEQEKRSGEMERLMERRSREDEGVFLTEDDDGVALGFPHTTTDFYKIWNVIVKSRGLGSSRSLAGRSQLYLSATSLLLVRMGPGPTQSLRILLTGVRRCGHAGKLFYMDVGRLAPCGPGEIWMEAGDKGDPELAELIHKTVLYAMRASQFVPDLAHTLVRKPNTQKQLRFQTGCKNTKSMCREKGMCARQFARSLSPSFQDPGPTPSPAGTDVWNLRLLIPDESTVESSPGSTSHSSLSPGHAGNTRSCLNIPFDALDLTCDDSCPAEPPSALDAQDRRRSSPESGNYMDMSACGVSTATGDHFGETENSVEISGAAGQEPDEEGGYMRMSPRYGHGVAASWGDDYMRPHTHTLQAATSSSAYCRHLQTLYNSQLQPSSGMTSDNLRPDTQRDSGLDQSDFQCTEISQSDRTFKLNQLDDWKLQVKTAHTFTASSLSLDQHACVWLDHQVELLPAGQCKSQAQSTTSSYSPDTKPEHYQAILNSEPELSTTPQSSPVQTNPDQSNEAKSTVRRRWLSSCLPACLKVKDEN